MDTIQYIKSAQNKKIKFIRKLLLERKERDKNKLFVAEGFKVFNQLLLSQIPLELFCSEDFYRKLDTRSYFYKHLSQNNIPLNIVDNSLFYRLSSLAHAEGILGIFKQIKFNIYDYLNTKPFVGVLCENLQDPTNLGSIIRNCFCLGAHALFLTDHSIDIYNPKVVRSSAGYLMQLPIFYVTFDDIKAWKAKNIYLLSTKFKNINKSKSLSDFDQLPSKVIIIFGNEGIGLSQRLIALSDDYFYIPMREGSESLNISTAIAVTLFSMIPKVQ